MHRKVQEFAHAEAQGATGLEKTGRAGSSGINRQNAQRDVLAALGMARMSSFGTCGQQGVAQ